MKKIIYKNVESLIMSRLEVEGLLIGYANNEIRADELLQKETNEIFKKSLEYQKAKARGFKEAIEGLMFVFTGNMINVEDGRLTKKDGAQS